VEPSLRQRVIGDEHTAGGNALVYSARLFALQFMYFESRQANSEA
jgi:hypothetical protein